MAFLIFIIAAFCRSRFVIVRMVSRPSVYEFVHIEVDVPDSVVYAAIDCEALDVAKLSAVKQDLGFHCGFSELYGDVLSFEYALSYCGFD